MFKKLLAIVAMLYVALSFAAVDVNKGTAAELDGIKGIGPAKSSQIMAERKKGDFKDWKDFITRVSGIGEKSAANLSQAGLTVNGKPYPGTEAKPAAAPAPKAEVKAQDKAVAPDAKKK
jgi:competence protein ComEA